MKKKDPNHQRKSGLAPGILLWLALFPLLLACASGFNGRIEFDDEVTQTFESYTILPDHNYYISGSDTSPQGIIAIDQKFTLKKTNLWRAQEATPERMKKWLNPRPRVGIDTSRRGYFMYGPNNERIGLYYPAKNWRDRVSVKLEEDNQVVVSGVMDGTNKSRKREGKGD